MRRPSRPIQVVLALDHDVGGLVVPPTQLLNEVKSRVDRGSELSCSNQIGHRQPNRFVPARLGQSGDVGYDTLDLEYIRAGFALQLD